MDEIWHRSHAQMQHAEGSALAQKCALMLCVLTLRGYDIASKTWNTDQAHSYVGPIAKKAGEPAFGGDVAFELGFLFAFVTYFGLRKLELRYFHR